MPDQGHFFRVTINRTFDLLTITIKTENNENGLANGRI